MRVLTVVGPWMWLKKKMQKVINNREVRIVINTKKPNYQIISEWFEDVRRNKSRYPEGKLLSKGNYMDSKQKIKIKERRSRISEPGKSKSRACIKLVLCVIRKHLSWGIWATLWGRIWHTKNASLIQYKLESLWDSCSEGSSDKLQPKNKYRASTARGTIIWCLRSSNQMKESHSQLLGVCPSPSNPPLISNFPWGEYLSPGLLQPPIYAHISNYQESFWFLITKNSPIGQFFVCLKSFSEYLMFEKKKT